MRIKFEPFFKNPDGYDVLWLCGAFGIAGIAVGAFPDSFGALGLSFFALACGIFVQLPFFRIVWLLLSSLWHKATGKLNA